MCQVMCFRGKQANEAVLYNITGYSMFAHVHTSFTIYARAKTTDISNKGHIEIVYFFVLNTKNY